ncbi:Serine/threonine-protein phosphatase 4 regulatory subunit 2 [Linum grandiflorum]
MASTAETTSDLATTSAGDKVSEHPQDGASAATVLVPEASDHRGDEPGSADPEEEAGAVLELIASTGKFWHNWHNLKIILSSKLKQVRGVPVLGTLRKTTVLSEYPEVNMTGEEQKASLGETYPDLVKRLDDALHSFVDGPPFTLQRLCEILLAARSIYPNLSKLALALEKNLLVTSTLTACTDPCPLVKPKQDEADDASLKQQKEQPSKSEENGVQTAGTDGDEIMAEVETDIGEEMKIDMEAFEETK